MDSIMTFIYHWPISIPEPVDYAERRVTGVRTAHASPGMELCPWRRIMSKSVKNCLIISPLFPNMKLTTDR
jgi:hypothetical protein